MITRTVPGAQNLIIVECDGKATLSQAHDVFGYVEPDFKSEGFDEPDPATPEIKVSVREMVADGTFRQVFTSLSVDLDKLCLTQAQIIGFIRDHRKHRHPEGYATFFLYKKGSKFFVIYVFEDSFDCEKPFVRSHFLDYRNLWDGDIGYRVVIPQL